MDDLARLVTYVDVSERDPDRSVTALHMVVLSDGRQITLLDDRGWASSAPVERRGLDQVERDARTVVGPDEPVEGSTWAQSEDSHWAYLTDKLRMAGVRDDERALRMLPHQVEMSDRLRKRLLTATD